MIGQLLGGRYQIVSVLGAGSFGQTYRAIDSHRPGNAPCVVKHLKPASTDSRFLPMARDLFKREAMTLERLGHHDQIPRLLAYFEEHQEFYLVQDFIAGQVLRSELPVGCCWTATEVIQFLQDTLTILEFVHSCGVIHRDIKPDNLIRRQADQRLVLIDFGAVKQMRMSLANPLEGEQIGGTIAIGTPGYMPPEQAQGRPRPNSDLYAVGMIAIQALTGLPPSQLQQDAQGIWLWQSQTAISDGLEQLIHRMVRPHWQERYQSAAEVLQVLQQFDQAPRWWQRMGHLLRTPVGELGVKPPLVPRAMLPDLVPATITPAPSPLVSGVPTALSGAGQIRIFISYHHQQIEIDLAQEFFRHLEAAGHAPFMAGQSIHLGEGWGQRIDAELQSCDYFLLLLSPQSASSEMVLEEVRTVKNLQGSRRDNRPIILPIRVNFPMGVPLNYELRGYLHRVQQRFWRSPEDTPELVAEVLELLGDTPTQSGISASPEPTSNGVIPTLPPLVVIADSPPLPVAEPELPEGQVEIASAFYVDRPPIESRCFETILQPGALIRIKAPRQMGKTSLMARILSRASQSGYCAVPLSLQLADAKVFKDLDKFLPWLCASIGRRLGLPNQLKDYWDEIFGSKYNCTTYFEEYLLPQIDRPLALGLDEVDRVFEYPELASDFFGLLRAWHEEAKNREIWKNLRLVVVHATEVYIPLNTNQSPFNVGLPIELPEFGIPQVEELTRRHGLDWGPSEVDRLMAMVGGHPYLVRLALYHIARQDSTLTELLSSAATEEGCFRDHLHWQSWHLQQHPELGDAFRQVLAAAGPVRIDTTALFKLRSLGLVNLEGNQAVLRCQLYRQYFAACGE
jgi:serine/threonine protein kinase